MSVYDAVNLMLRSVATYAAMCILESKTGNFFYHGVTDSVTQRNRFLSFLHNEANNLYTRQLLAISENGH